MIEFAVVLVIKRTLQQKYFIFPKVDKKEEDEDEEPQSKQRKNLKTARHHENIKINGSMTADHVTNRIDTLSFFVFLFLYSLFNIVYWIHYSKG